MSSTNPAFSTARRIAAVMIVLAAPLPLAAQPLCAIGSYSPTGRAACTLATPGHVVRTVGAKTQSLTNPGTYAPNAGMWEAFKAQPGYFVPGFGATSQTPAPLGYYAPTKLMTAPLAALPGFYVPHVASTTEAACPLHTDSYGAAPACRFVGGPSLPPVPGSVGPQFLASFLAGGTIDVGQVPLSGSLTLHEWIENGAFDLQHLGVSPTAPVAKLTALTLLGSTFQLVPAGQLPAVQTTLAGLPNGTVLGEGGVQPFDITFAGLRGGHFDELFTFWTDQTAEYGATGRSFQLEVTGTVTPEPATLSLLAIGALGIGGVAYRRRRTIGARRD